MLIYPKWLAFDYDHNDIVEREIARLLSEVSGLPASEFGNGTPRLEFDFILGSMPLEVKITNGVALPVEVSKMQNGSVPSGVASSKAPYIVYLSHGHGERAEGSPPVGKLRLLPRKKLLTMARQSQPTFYKGTTASQDALVHYVQGPYFTDDIFVGNMEFKYSESDDIWMYDTSTFVPHTYAGARIRWAHQGYVDGDIS